MIIHYNIDHHCDQPSEHSDKCCHWPKQLRWRFWSSSHQCCSSDVIFSSPNVIISSLNVINRSHQCCSSDVIISSPNVIISSSNVIISSLPMLFLKLINRASVFNVRKSDDTNILLSTLFFKCDHSHLPCSSIRPQLFVNVSKLKIWSYKYFPRTMPFHKCDDLWVICCSSNAINYSNVINLLTYWLIDCLLNECGWLLFINWLARS